ncbi:hypothetical protein AFL01nite_10360 [Aeromicrobium flavum]|uniref:DUF4386 domain-containing protein n=1 Tax=Aeromicrobium flavum TaxID=416568 RepID=A0A512HTD1_9ACTN|nr:hypothetical protein [Aeromicrobium flavum]GEO88709.1 hypothetical protein AFL01nite_10360 [Aeromicrobium flavum]
MSTHITTTQRVRDDLPQSAAGTPGRGWALAGVVAGVGGFATTILSMSAGAAYVDGEPQDADRIAASLGDHVPELISFHVVATLTVLALVPFGLGLHRRLRAGLGHDSLVPGTAAFGILGTALVVLMGTALNTEFIFGVADGLAVPEAATVFNHWIATVPWVWGLTGLTGWALFRAWRAGAVRGWIGIAGAVLGTLSLLLSVVPLQYMAGWTGSVMVALAGLGFAFGDRGAR